MTYTTASYTDALESSISKCHNTSQACDTDHLSTELTQQALLDQKRESNCFPISISPIRRGILSKITSFVWRSTIYCITKPFGLCCIRCHRFRSNNQSEQLYLCDNLVKSNFEDPSVHCLDTLCLSSASSVTNSSSASHTEEVEDLIFSDNIVPTVTCVASLEEVLDQEDMDFMRGKLARFASRASALKDYVQESAQRQFGRKRPEEIFEIAWLDFRREMEEIMIREAEMDETESSSSLLRRPLQYAKELIEAVRQAGSISENVYPSSRSTISTPNHQRNNEGMMSEQPTTGDTPSKHERFQSLSIIEKFAKREEIFCLICAYGIKDAPRGCRQLSIYLLAHLFQYLDIDLALSKDCRSRLAQLLHISARHVQPRVLAMSVLDVDSELDARSAVGENESLRTSQRLESRLLDMHKKQDPSILWLTLCTSLILAHVLENPTLVNSEFFTSSSGDDTKHASLEFLLRIIVLSCLEYGSAGEIARSTVEMIYTSRVEDVSEALLAVHISNQKDNKLSSNCPLLLQNVIKAGLSVLWTEFHQNDISSTLHVRTLLCIVLRFCNTLAKHHDWLTHNDSSLHENNEESHTVKRLDNVEESAAVMTPDNFTVKQGQSYFTDDTALPSTIKLHTVANQILQTWADRIVIPTIFPVSEKKSQDSIRILTAFLSIFQDLQETENATSSPIIRTLIDSCTTPKNSSQSAWKVITDTVSSDVTDVCITALELINTITSVASVSQISHALYQLLETDETVIKQLPTITTNPDQMATTTTDKTISRTMATTEQMTNDQTTTTTTDKTTSHTSNDPTTLSSITVAKQTFYTSLQRLQTQLDTAMTKWYNITQQLFEMTDIDQYSEQRIIRSTLLEMDEISYKMTCEDESKTIIVNIGPVLLYKLKNFFHNEFHVNMALSGTISTILSAPHPFPGLQLLEWNYIKVRQEELNFRALISTLWKDALKRISRIIQEITENAGFDWDSSATCTVGHRVIRAILYDIRNKYHFPECIEENQNQITPEEWQFAHKIEKSTHEFLEQTVLLEQITLELQSLVNAKIQATIQIPSIDTIGQ